jgi:Ni,Fe-hydrogenase maturation factor
LAVKLSPHRIDIREVRARASLRGTLPGRAVAMGVQPEQVALGMELAPLVAEALEGLVLRVVERLEAWGHACARREAPVDA